MPVKPSFPIPDFPMHALMPVLAALASTVDGVRVDSSTDPVVTSPPDLVRCSFNHPAVGVNTPGADHHLEGQSQAPSAAGLKRRSRN